MPVPAPAVEGGRSAAEQRISSVLPLPVRKRQQVVAWWSYCRKNHCIRTDRTNAPHSQRRLLTVVSAKSLSLNRSHNFCPQADDSSGHWRTDSALSLWRAKMTQQMLRPGVLLISTWRLCNKEVTTTALHPLGHRARMVSPGSIWVTPKKACWSEDDGRRCLQAAVIRTEKTTQETCRILHVIKCVCSYSIDEIGSVPAGIVHRRLHDWLSVPHARHIALPHALTLTLFSRV